MSKESATDLMRQIFPTNPGERKFKALYDLAKMATGGCIIEVGTGHGHGLVSLILGTLDGANLQVYSIDPNNECRGWANEPYGPMDRPILFKNLLDAQVADKAKIINLLAHEIVDCWPHPVALLWWDLGQHYDKHEDTILKWAQKIIPGGILALNETFDNHLKVDAVVGNLAGFELLRINYAIRILRRDDVLAG